MKSSGFQKYRRVLKALRRLPSAHPSLYNTPKEIAPLRWVRHWMSSSKGSAPGLFGLTHDIMAALTYVGKAPPNDDVEALAICSETSEILRQLVSSVYKTKMVFQGWKRRAIRVILKVEGDMGINNARPIILLDILCKCIYRDLTNNLNATWEKHGLLSNMQCASKKGAGAEQPLTVLKFLSEEAFEKKRTLLAFSQDISKACDNAERHLAVEIALRRFGLLEDIIQIHMEVQRDNSVDMLTAYGKSSDILGDSTGRMVPSNRCGDSPRVVVNVQCFGLRYTAS